MIPKAAFNGLAGVLACLSVMGTATPLEARNKTLPKPSIDFKKCDSALNLTSAFECGFLTVPIDHDNPEDGTIDLFVSRRKANSSKSLGSLIFNQGGPGAATSYFFQLLAPGLPILSDDLVENYDLIAIDPRGIGYSNPLTCDKDLWNKAPLPYATDKKGYDKLVAFNKAFGKSCLKLTGPLAGFMDSVSTVKDFELVRQALGEEKLNYLGFSYGTLLGQTYAELYPEHVGRMVLDALVDHSPTDPMQTIMTESQTYQATLEEFFSWCNVTSNDCPLAGQDARAIFKKVTSAKSLPAPRCKGVCKTTITGKDVLLAAQTRLIFQDSIAGSWFALGDQLNQTVHGDASSFSTPFKTNNTDRSLASDFALRAVFCQDWGSSLKSWVDLQGIQRTTAALLPLTRGASGALTAEAYCAGWPAPVRNPPHRLAAKKVAKLPKVLLVNALLDPETSAVWAQGVRDQMPSAVNVWRDGAGHTSYILYGETSRAMDAFLINGTLPADGTTFKS